jgi:hypothetical protein
LSSQQQQNFLNGKFGFVFANAFLSLDVSPHPILHDDMKKVNKNAAVIIT